MPFAPRRFDAIRSPARSMNRRGPLVAIPILLVPLLVWGMLRESAPPPTPAPESSLPSPVAARPELPLPPNLPQDVATLMRQGRPWRAARLLRERPPSTAPALVLVAARAEAGWGGWENARRLLEGRPWL